MSHRADQPSLYFRHLVLILIQWSFGALPLASATEPTWKHHTCTIDCSHVFCMAAWAHRMERQTNVNAKAKAIDPACEHVRTPYTALRTHTYSEHESCMCSSQQAYVVVRANKHTLCNCVLDAYAHSSVFVFTSSFSVAFTIDPSRRSFFTLKLLSLLR